MAVVLPAPRKPPVMMYRAFLGLMSLPQHLVDRRVENGYVALDVQDILSRRPPERVQPSSPGGIRLDKLYFLGQVRVASLEAAGEWRVQIRNGFEALDP